MGEYGLGRLVSHDVNDERYLMRAAMPRGGTAAPIDTLSDKTWDMRAPALDQGSTGTCTGHAATTFYLCAPMRHAKPLVSPFQLYREGVLLDEWTDNDGEATLADGQLQFGSSGRAMMKALEARGVIEEYRWGYTLDDVVRWVHDRGPVMIGSDWLEDMFNPTAEGFVKATGAVAGGHEYCVRGVHPKRAIARVVNSWGVRWNHAAKPPKGLHLRGGEFLIAFEDLHKLLREGGDAVSGIERKKAA